MDYLKIDLYTKLIKYIGFNIGLSICFFKLLNDYKNLCMFKKITIVICSICLGILQAVVTNYIPSLYVLIPTSLLFGTILSKFTTKQINNIHAISIVSLCISYTLSLVTIVFGSVFVTTFKNISYSNYIAFFIADILQILFIIFLFKIKRLKHGFTFFNNDYLKISILFVTAFFIAIFTFFIGVMDKQNIGNDLVYTLFLLAIIFLLIIKESFTLYQKQKNQTKTMKEYEIELEETKQKLKTALEEKEKIVKSNHEFYHRQEALKNKLNTLINSSNNTEFANELTSINDRINVLTEEYKEKLSTQPKLPTSGIVELDDMLLYFQNECSKNDIEFIVKEDCNINKIIDNYITKSELETLIGDLMRNAIIAINNSSNTFKSILLVFGLKNSHYEIDIFDSGINFEINTLLNIGINKCSTHLDDGGTGIGFITTFETINKSKSSIIIEEYNSNSYSKMIGIIFDNLNEYRINSYRADLIQKENKLNRNIVFYN